MKGLGWGSRCPEAHPPLPMWMQGLCETLLRPRLQWRNSPAPSPHTHPSAPSAVTCLLEDILVSVLMLLVSVTTIAEGKREVWEYWGGSCLCAYTAERRETSGRHGKATQSPRAGAERPSAALRQVAGGLCGNERRGGVKEIKQAMGRNHRLPRSHHFLSSRLAK